MNRRDFIRSAAFGTAFVSARALAGGGKEKGGGLIVPKGNGMRITGTFLDEISHDIPHQNWGEKEWDADFAHMKAIGIDTVIMIRCGHRRFITYPSRYLLSQGCHMPSVDLVDMFLRLSEKHGMAFYFGLYDPGLKTTDSRLIMDAYSEKNMYVIEEVWKRYGGYPAFKGWYLSSEFNRLLAGVIPSVRRMGRQCKDCSPGLKTFISPSVQGRKALSSYDSAVTRGDGGITVTRHEKEWYEIFDGIHEVIDACAFQDGHVDYGELPEFLSVNKRLCDKYGIESWTNVENFDRDMPIKFLPIKFDKMRLKLEAAKKAGISKAITFEFSHFMSPQSMYPSAGNLYNRYREYFGI